MADEIGESTSLSLYEHRLLAVTYLYGERNSDVEFSAALAALCRKLDSLLVDERKFNRLPITDGSNQGSQAAQAINEFVADWWLPRGQEEGLDGALHVFRAWRLWNQIARLHRSDPSQFVGLHAVGPAALRMGYIALDVPDTLDYDRAGGREAALTSMKDLLRTLRKSIRAQIDEIWPPRLKSEFTLERKVAWYSQHHHPSRSQTVSDLARHLYREQCAEQLREMLITSYPNKRASVEGATLTDIAHMAKQLRDMLGSSDLTRFQIQELLDGISEPLQSRLLRESTHEARGRPKSDDIRLPSLASSRQTVAKGIRDIEAMLHTDVAHGAGGG